MVRFAGPQVGLFPMLWRQAHAATVPQPAPGTATALEHVSIRVAPPPRPLELDLSSLNPPGGRALKRSGACIGEQNEVERVQAARCVVEGGRWGGTGPADIYLRHSTALVLQESETYSSPASARHEVIGIAIGRDRRCG